MNPSATRKQDPGACILSSNSNFNSRAAKSEQRPHQYGIRSTTCTRTYIYSALPPSLTSWPSKILLGFILIPSANHGSLPTLKDPKYFVRHTSHQQRRYNFAIQPPSRPSKGRPVAKVVSNRRVVPLDSTELCPGNSSMDAFHLQQ